MRTKIAAVFVVVSLFLTVTPFSLAQASPNDWGALRKILDGTDLYIKTFRGKVVKGKISGVTDDEIELYKKGKILKLPKTDVREVYFAVQKSGKRGAIIGTTVGLFVGGLAGGSVNRRVVYEEDFNWGAPLLGMLGGMIGGHLLGKKIGKRKKKGALIYKAS